MAYVTLAEIRALPNLADVTKFPDAKLTAARDWFEAAFERYTAVSWVLRTVTETVSGDGGTTLLVSKMFPRTPTAVSLTSGGVATAFVAADLADLVVYDHGALVRLSRGTWPAGNRNVSITYQHGPPPGYADVPPADVKEAALMAIRDRLLNPDPNRQFAVSTELGIVRNSTPGPRSPFGIQFVDEVANAPGRFYRIPGLS